MEKHKLVYRDGDFLKVLKGKLIKEDSLFFTFECDDSVYKINKKDIVSVKTPKEEK